MNLYKNNILPQHTHWIFDMDGTLTIAAHNFVAIRAELGLPPDQPILESLAALPPQQADPLRRRLAAIELELAQQAKPQPGAGTLLQSLKQRGIQLGILTRNSQRNALETLRACGLLGFFDSTYILSRDSAAPKPNPEGIHKLLTLWRAQPSATVMVGDYHFDLLAGRRAGTTTVYVDVDQKNTWATHADITVHSLDELLALAIGFPSDSV